MARQWHEKTRLAVQADHQDNGFVANVLAGWLGGRRRGQRRLDFIRSSLTAAQISPKTGPSLTTRQTRACEPLGRPRASATAGGPRNCPYFVALLVSCQQGVGSP